MQTPDRDTSISPTVVSRRLDPSVTTPSTNKHAQDLLRLDDFQDSEKRLAAAGLGYLPCSRGISVLLHGDRRALLNSRQRRVWLEMNDQIANKSSTEPLTGIKADSMHHHALIFVFLRYRDWRQTAAISNTDGYHLRLMHSRFPVKFLDLRCSRIVLRHRP